MIKWFFLSILAIGSGLGAYLFVHLGAFKDVTIEVQMYPDFYVIYTKHRGPYHEINGSLIQLEKQLRNEGIACKKTFGHFLDDPAVVDADRLRSHIGCVISKENQQQLKNSEPPQWFTQVFSLNKVIYSRFQGSPAIGPMKVYPKVREFADKQRVALRPDVIELYTVQRDGQVITEYLFPLDSQ